ncbi:hypothetical protein EDB19DRAFT_1745047 [Suillus lakei]|nr:hypothetical protein EDB19DRAFT_1761244 [Suillus lakei]KAG1728893.1 hypothetical protein EDB19DRAFT_1745047 [Suillus lakei]
MISRIRRALLSLVFTPWVSAAPATQRSELLLVEPPLASCNFDFSAIQHELCALVHDVARIVEDEATLTSPYIIDQSENSWKEVSDTPISGRRPGHDSDARRLIVIEHNTQSPNFDGVNFPGGHFSANVGGVLTNFVFLPEGHMDELDSVHVIGCTHRLTWESLHACDQEHLEPGKIEPPYDGRPKRYELLQEEEGLFRGKDTDTNSKIFENGEAVSHNVDTRGDEGNKNGDNPDDGRPDENPTDEQDDEQEFIPPTNRNPWPLTIILFMTSSVLIFATRIFYVPLRGLLRPYLKPNRFRVGETMLLRWAHEDMNFDGEEEDTMVNGSDGLITGEEIPLKPSPRKNFVIQYGSAQ